MNLIFAGAVLGFYFVLHNIQAFLYGTSVFQAPSCCASCYPAALIEGLFPVTSGTSIKKVRTHTTDIQVCVALTEVPQRHPDNIKQFGNHYCTLVDKSVHMSGSVYQNSPLSITERHMSRS